MTPGRRRCSRPSATTGTSSTSSGSGCSVPSSSSRSRCADSVVAARARRRSRSPSRLVFFGARGDAAPRSTAATLTAATTSASPASSLAAGEELFDDNCSTCHGAERAGRRARAEPAGRRRGDGRPLGLERAGCRSRTRRPSRSASRTKFDRPADRSRSPTTSQSLAPGRASPIPKVDLKGAERRRRASDLFALNCAPCHTITGAGDALSNGVYAPAAARRHARRWSPRRSAPGRATCPASTPCAISKPQLTDVVAYVTKDIEHPTNPGGLGLGGVGPVAEGFVGLFVGVGACMLVALWIGDRTDARTRTARARRRHDPTTTEVVHV